MAKNKRNEQDLEKHSGNMAADPFPPPSAEGVPSATGVAADADELDEAKPSPNDRS